MEIKRISTNENMSNTIKTTTDLQSNITTEGEEIKEKLFECYKHDFVDVKRNQEKNQTISSVLDKIKNAKENQRNLFLLRQFAKVESVFVISQLKLIKEVTQNRNFNNEIKERLIEEIEVTIIRELKHLERKLNREEPKARL